MSGHGLQNYFVHLHPLLLQVDTCWFFLGFLKLPQLSGQPPETRMDSSWSLENHHYHTILIVLDDWQNKHLWPLHL